MKRLISFGLLLSSLLAPRAGTAGGEWHVGNSGNPTALDFAKSAQAAIQVVDADPLDYPGVQNSNLENILENAHILVSEIPYYVNQDGVQQRAAAVNYQDSDLIVIDQELWSEIGDLSIKKALALHEVLGLAGLEQTGDYPISEKYLASLGVKCTQELCAPEETEGNPLLGSSAQSAFAGTPSVQGAQDPYAGFNPYGFATGTYNPAQIWSATSYLTGGVDSTDGTFDLTQEGETDWIQWSYMTSRKATDTPILPDYSYLQPYQSASAYNSDSRPLSWTDGTPTQNASNDRSGYFVSNGGRGLFFTAPSDQNVRVLVVHVSDFFAGARLTAELADGSATVYQDDRPASNTVNGDDYNYTIVYSSKNPTRIKISWHVMSVTGNVNLSAAALSLAGYTRAANQISGTWNNSQASADLTQEGALDWVHWGSQNHKVGGGNQISDFSTSEITEGGRVLTWSDGAENARSGKEWLGISLEQMNNGFVFKVPTGNLRQHLTLHVSGDRAGAVLTAVLNDGSGYTYTDVIAPSRETYQQTYSLDFNSSEPSTMTVTWKMTSALGRITLNGMALK
jgi:hypothetical protein